MIIELILLSIVNASISFTITESVLFQPLRQYLKTKTIWLSKLVSCGYCLGHWTALGLVSIYQFNLFHSNILIDYFCTILVISWLSAVQWLLMCYLMKLTDK